MKILYAVQATGNGHISRAMELYPHLKEYGAVDIFLSGANCSLPMSLPIKYRSKGLSLHYSCKGGLDYWQLLKSFQPMRLRQEIRDLPVEKYDLIINDFEYITAAACAKKKIPSINFGHQASFLSPHTPRPEKRNPTGEWVLKNYARASRYVGLHFQKYDDFIFTPVIKKEILLAQPTDKKYIAVYLPSWCEPQLKKIFRAFPDYRFEIFSWQTTKPVTERDITLLPVDSRLFNHSLIHCTGIITGGGFETPAEALHLGKKIISIPIRAQYEQQCNAAALQLMGGLCLKTIDDNFADHFHDWISSTNTPRTDYSQSIPQSLAHLFSGKRELVEEEVMTADYDLFN
ncbi:MAG: glycosyltransferase family protein [Chitinophagaceae bacterium]